LSRLQSMWSQLRTYYGPVSRYRLAFNRLPGLVGYAILPRRLPWRTGSMRQLRVLPLIVVVLASGPALADDYRDCYQRKDPGVRIKGCSALILRDRADPTTYYNRAIAYEMRGDIDIAIMDYTKAIELAPDYAAAYDNRGRIYARKGDYTRAMADVLMASQLAGQFGARPTAAKTAAIPPKQDQRLNRRQRFTMWGCCRLLATLLSARWLHRLNCPAHEYARWHAPVR
jgi:tetratricopeptide (TPR) repeat protein